MTGTTLTDSSKAALTSAIIATVSETLRVATSAVTDVSFLTGRRMLLSDVTISYTLTVLSGETSDYHASALQASVQNGNFLNSLVLKSGVPISGAYDFRTTNYSPTPSPVPADSQVGTSDPTGECAILCCVK